MYDTFFIKLSVKNLIHNSNPVSRKLTRTAQAQVQNAFDTLHQLPKWGTRPNPT
jgi:hypothetical protein